MRMRGRLGQLPLLWAVGALVAGLGLNGCVSEPSAVTGERRSYGYSWQQELQLGEQTDAQITQQMGLLEDTAVQAYVAEIGERVLARSDLRAPDAPELYAGADFTFRVLDSPVVNAFALPGGYVYVTRGLLTHLQNEAQLAVVLGHETAHVVARHASQQAWRAQLGQIGLVGAAILGQQVLGEGGRDVAGNILQMGGQALQLFMFRYSRGAERESDELGVRYASQAGYATAEGAEFFRSLERISEKEGQALPSWASTHPDPGERAVRVRELSGAWTPIGGEVAAVVDEEEFMRRIEGVVLGENPREGFERDGMFVHPELRFRFPVPMGWKLQNERAIVIMAEPNGGAVMGFEIVPASSPREAATQFAQQEGVQVVSVVDTLINRQAAVAVLAQAATQSGPIGILATLLQHDGKVYSFLGYAAAPNFEQYRHVFEQTPRGFATLTDPAVLQIEPTRLRVTMLDRPRTFRELLPAVLPPGLTAEDLAIMNQVELDQRLPAGRRVKLPEL